MVQCTGGESLLLIGNVAVCKQAARGANMTLAGKVSELPLQSSGVFRSAVLL